MPIVPPKDKPIADNGILKNLFTNVKTVLYGVVSKNILIKKKSISITKAGVIAENDFDTAGGTDSGILIIQFLLMIYINISVEIIAVKIAGTNPLAEKLVVCQTFPRFNVSPFFKTSLIFNTGVKSKNAANAIDPADNPSTFLSFAK